MISITIRGKGLARFQKAVKVLGSEKRARVAYSRAINKVGGICKTAAGRALAAQTGLPKRTAARAVSQDLVKSTPDTLTFTINGTGGNVRLKYFNPRETRKGVSASPWNKRQVYGSTFMKAGWWPKRVNKPGWNGLVFSRTGDRKFTKMYPAGNKQRPKGMDQFEVEYSGLFIPREMERGKVQVVWQRGLSQLEKRIKHEIKQITKGVVT